MSQPVQPPDDTWMEVAQTMNSLEAEMIAGLLRTANIPSYIEGNALGLPSTFWGMSSPSRVFVPAKYYDEALDFLDEKDSELPALEEPYIEHVPSTMNGTLTDIDGIRVGHAHDLEAGMTGCTVILCPPQTVAGVDQRGGAPGTRETDMLRPMHRVQHIHALFLAGGSAFGLAVGDGVMRYLEENGIGYETRSGILVPIVPGAILFDLDLGDPKIRPDAAMGYAACTTASDAPVQQGTVGAGVGAKVGGILGNEFATKGGIGSASLDLGNGLKVAALFAVNAVGDILDEHGEIIAGVRQPPDGKTFANTLDVLQKMTVEPPPINTVIGVVATNARLNKEDTNKMAQMAHDGLARAVRPAHLPFDGDTIFALSTGTHESEHPALLAIIGAFAAEVTALAIREAVRRATSLGGILAAKDIPA